MDHLRSRAVGRHDGQIVVAHDVPYGHQQTPPEASARVQAREIDARETPHLHQRHGQRVAHGDLRRGRRSGCEVQDASLLLHPHVEVHVGVLGQRRVGVSGHRNQLVAVGVDEGDDLEDFVRLARIGERDHDVLLRNHAQVAVEGFAGMEKEARGSGRSERRGDLAPHEARLAHARNDTLAAASEDHLHGRGKLVAESVFHAFERQHFGMDRLAGNLQNLRLGRICHA